MAEGEPLYFVRFPSGNREVWTVEPIEPVEPADVARRFPQVVDPSGSNLTSRARPDARSILVRATRESHAE